MTWQTWHFLLQQSPDLNYLWFVVFATICSYSFHWYLTAPSVLPSERTKWLQRFRIIHAILFFIGIVGSVIFFIPLQQYWLWLFGSVIATFLYSAPKIPHPWFRSLRKVALGKTIFLAFVWVYVTTILPIIISAQEWSVPFLLFVIGRFFFVYAICILFDYRDRLDDKAAGIRSLITLLSEKGVNTLFYASLIIYFIATLLLLNYGYGFIEILLLLIPGLVTGMINSYARKHHADMFWYLVMDGLMALPAILMLVAAV